MSLCLEADDAVRHAKIRAAKLAKWQLGNPSSLDNDELDELLPETATIERRRNPQDRFAIRENAGTIVRRFNRWRVVIEHRYERHHVGNFDTLAEAEAALAKARDELRAANQWRKGPADNAGSIVMNRRGHWQAQISYRGVNHWVGTFATRERAERALERKKANLVADELRGQTT